MHADIASGKFIENAEFSGNLYGIYPSLFLALLFLGTSFAAAESVLSTGKYLILDIERQGVLQLQKSTAFNPPPLYIFIAPPSLELLETRLRGRGTETDESLQKRLETAKQEMEWGLTAGSVDIVITNDLIDQAYTKLVSAIFG